MDVLVPVDGSDCSMRAVRFAADFARKYDADIEVIHITDVAGEDSQGIVDEAEAILAEEGIVSEPSINLDVRVSGARYANQVGKDILEIVEDNEYDHVVMGHHGEGVVGRIVLGSAARTVMKATDVPVTIVP